ncbi:hypothetical protein GCM10007047_17720 [Cerasicoccus arenae]|uniref:Gfo/Idh/MocA-like oxidoreductase N-terminal domain-containing protein n=2 Tax=Cerasicoccus arenae TaxID=424488 RepID=A0A8J3DC46_9BACT|nr:hypothetical protein GCM10007047_17720 [Cerasicoccus arenae]
MRLVGVALYGDVGHQLHHEMLQGKYPGAKLLAVARFQAKAAQLLADAGIPVYSSLEELLDDPTVDLIVFCSPRKDEQGEQIIRALNAGKHAYAEKPCCLTESALDRIIEASLRTGKRFHEMNNSSLAQPYLAMREIVTSGVLGEIIQVFSQKSYPWMDWRPKDERIDGGLARQVGIYNLRFAEQVAGMKITSLKMEETPLGIPHTDSDCKRAISMQMRFESGAIGSAIANYCCPPPNDWGQWGYETLRIFGERGFVESIDNGRIGILALNGQSPSVLDVTAPSVDFFELFLEEIVTEVNLSPFTLEEELRPVRWLLRIKS